MKRLTAGVFAAILTVVGLNAAHANIASQGYVNQQVNALANGAVKTNTDNIALKADKTDVDNALLLKQDAALITADQYDANKANDAAYPSVKAVANALQKTGGDVSGLADRVSANETAIKGLTTKDSELAGEIETVSGFVTANKGILDSHAESILDNSNAITALEGKVSTNETNIATNAAAITSGDAATLVAAKKYADENDATYDDAEVRGLISANTTKIGENTTAIGTKAAQADLNTLSTTVSDMDKAYKDADTAINTALGAKANTADVYTKTETYTKAEVNTELAKKQDNALAPAGSFDEGGNYTGPGTVSTAYPSVEFAQQIAADAVGVKSAEFVAVEQGQEQAGNALTVDASGNVVSNAKLPLAALADDVATQVELDAVSAAANAKVNVAQGADAINNVMAVNAEGNVAPTKVTAAMVDAASVATVTSVASAMDAVEEQIESVNTELGGVKAGVGQNADALRSVVGDIDADLRKVLQNPGECSDAGKKCVLTYDNTGLAWEVVARGETETVTPNAAQTPLGVETPSLYNVSPE